MQDITVNGRELSIGFDSAMQGFRMTVWVWDGVEGEILEGYHGTLCLMMTQFEALCDLASELFDDAVHGETMAELLDIPIQFFDDEREDA